MLYSSRFAALLDANVLFPAPLRDFLLRLAQQELYKPKWSEQIHQEWIRNLLIKRPDLKEDSLSRARDAMNRAFPDSNISNYEEIERSLSLPDKDDNHVLAAAIHGGADVIVTFNLKDFPKDYLGKYDLEAQDPDHFISNLINLDAEKAHKALHEQITALKKAPQTKQDVLESLTKCGLSQSIKLLS